MREREREKSMLTLRCFCFQNGKISFEEFVCGLAIVLHGSFHDRCMLLFRVFNLNEDEGISRSELSLMLSHILHSTHTILHTIGESEASIVTGEDTDETVQRIVNAAFINCDITLTGKLLPLVSLCVAILQRCRKQF